MSRTIIGQKRARLKEAICLRVSAYYWDAVQFRTLDPLSSEQVAFVRGHCGSIHVSDEPMPYRQKLYKHRYQLKQPSDAAFEPFKTRPYLINDGELACDFAFDGWAARQEAHYQLHSHLYRPYHDAKHGTPMYSTGNLNRYDARREARNGMTMYVEDHCRITGELNCEHIEWRIQGAPAMRAKGVSTIEDLIGFDHKAFWARVLARMYRVDLERLGRLYRNKRERTRAKDALREQWGCVGLVNLDLKSGNIIAMAYAKAETGIPNVPITVQDLVDAFGMKFVRRCLVPMPVHVAECDRGTEMCDTLRYI